MNEGKGGLKTFLSCVCGFGAQSFISLNKRKGTVGLFQ